MTAPRFLRPGPGQLALALAGVPDRPVCASPRRLRAVKAHERAAAPPPRPAPPKPPRPAPPVRKQHPGDLHGAGPTSRQVTTITLRVEQMPDGRWRLTQPRVPAWVAVASSAGQLVAEVRRGFVEAQCVAYADWRGTVPDIEVPSVNYDRRNGRRPKRSKPNPLRKDTHPPTAWLVLPDGRWRSPKGHLFAEECQVVQRVMQRRVRFGLAARPDATDQHERNEERQTA